MLNREDDDFWSHIRVTITSWVPTVMPPLPPELPSRLRELPNAVSAYGICLRLEATIQENNSKKDMARDQIFCRILGYLLHHIPTDQALKTVVYEVVSAKDDEALLKVGEMYFNHFIRACTSSVRFS